MFDHFLGKNRYEKIYCSQGELFRVPELSKRTDEYLGFVKKAGEEFAKGNISNISEKKTNMMILLMPWIAFWVAASISSCTGSIITIIISAISSLLFVKNKKTPYDVLSNSIVTMFSIIIILFDNAKIMIPLSYLCFGLMWSISCLTKVPLTAHYSKK